MDQTFITIHNLTQDANILFASDSITDILGFLPHEVQNRSCFDFFHPNEVPFARSIHSRGVRLDKAAVLHYARILSVDGRWVNCECCFTIVHDVLVACTSIYRRTQKSERRAIEAPQIRRLFSCSPRDPRYHMLEHLSPKFRMPAMEREPRAALILNRFTRSLSIMFSTNAVSTILGLSPQDLRDQSFYDCIQENCLEEAVRCLEGAKANDSIAYLRFWSKDPRRPEDIAESDRAHSTEAERDSEMTIKVEDTEDGAWDNQPSRSRAAHISGGSVRTQQHMDVEPQDTGGAAIKIEGDLEMEDIGVRIKRSSSEPPVRRMSELPSRTPSAASHISGSSEGGSQSRHSAASVELEAVVSCTSDGLVVVIRKARPSMPGLEPPRPPALQDGLFAAPWAQQPIHPSYTPDDVRDGRYARHDGLERPGGPPLESLMRSIRDVAVFAWALVGINENVAMHGNGVPEGEAVPSDWVPPPNGYPVRPGYREAESIGRSDEQCWMGCRCNVDKPPTFGYPQSMRTSQPANLHCDCKECRLPEQHIPSQPSSGCQQRDHIRAGSALRPRLRSHASTSSLPVSNPHWWAEHSGRSRRVAHRRDDAKKWPYPS